jgi:hypothetical protein
MPLDFKPFSDWCKDHFEDSLSMGDPRWKAYRDLYRSGVNLEDLTLIETLRLYFRAYLFMQDRMKSNRKPKTTDAQVLKKNERLFKRFGRIVADTLGANMENVTSASAGVGAQVSRTPRGGSFGADNLLPRVGGLSQFVTQSMPQRNAIDQVIDRVFQDFQIAIELESEGRPNDTWKRLIKEVRPMVPKLNGLLLKYHPDPFSLGKTPERWQTFILLAMVNYLEQKTPRRMPHYREAVDILNAPVPRLKSNDRLTYGSARTRVTQFKQNYPKWKRDVKALYVCARQFANGGAHSVRLSNPTC